MNASSPQTRIVLAPLPEAYQRFRQVDKLLRPTSQPGWQGKPRTCKTIAKHMGVNPKTIMRAVKFMRDKLGLPIAYNSKRRSFFYTEPITVVFGTEVRD